MATQYLDFFVMLLIVVLLLGGYARPSPSRPSD